MRTIERTRMAKLLVIAVRLALRPSRVIGVGSPDISNTRLLRTAMGLGNWRESCSCRNTAGQEEGLLLILTYP
jgi:hypothetical protein